MKLRSDKAKRAYAFELRRKKEKPSESVPDFLRIALGGGLASRSEVVDAAEGVRAILADGCGFAPGLTSAFASPSPIVLVVPRTTSGVLTPVA